MLELLTQGPINIYIYTHIYSAVTSGMLVTEGESLKDCANVPWMNLKIILQKQSDVAGRRVA